MYLVDQCLGIPCRDFFSYSEVQHVYLACPLIEEKTTKKKVPNSRYCLVQVQPLGTPARTQKYTFHSSVYIYSLCISMMIKEYSIVV